MIRKTALLIGGLSVVLGAGAALYGLVLQSAAWLISGWVVILFGIAIALAEMSHRND